MARTLTRKLSGSFAATLIVLLGIEVVIFYFTFERVISIGEDMSGRSLITMIREDFFAAERQDLQALLRAVTRAELAAPGISASLIKPDGSIALQLFNSAGVKSGVKVDPAPIAMAADSGLARRKPAFATDPTSERSTLKIPFAATRLTLSGEPYYLFINLKSIPTRKMRIMYYDWVGGRYAFGLPLLVLIFSLLAATVVFGIVTRRLRSLTSTISAYRLGDRTLRAPTTGTDELSELGASFNAMADTIASHLGELEDRDVKRRELISSVSHDLRGPLGVMELCAKELGEAPAIAGNERLASRVAALERHSTSLGALLHQLFELAKIEAAERTFVMAAVSVSDILDDCATAYRTAAEARGIKLELALPPAMPDVIADASALERVMANLVENALTYTLEGGTVQIFASAEGGAGRIGVTDTGVGISDEDLPYIFDRTYRVKRWETRDKTSGGLGLAIVKRIIEAHGSRIEVTTVEGSGSCFSFTLPYAPDRDFHR